eukprot:764163-Hanusia_phi.AAC.2
MAQESSPSYGPAEQRTDTFDKCKRPSSRLKPFGPSDASFLRSLVSLRIEYNREVGAIMQSEDEIGRAGEV